MQSYASRAGRWPLALTLTFAALTALSACSDEPMAPKTPRPLAAKVAPVVAADTYYVTTTSGGMEPGSLRYIAKKMEYSGGTILFDPSLGGKTINLEDRFEIYHPAEIIGPAKGITISGNNTFRLMYVGTLTMENVTVMKGNGEFGSAIEAYTAILRHTTVRDNSGPSSAIYVTGGLQLINSTVSGNTVGGPVVQYTSSSDLFIDNSTIAFNTGSAALGRRGSVGWSLSVGIHNSILANNGQNCTDYAGFYFGGTNIIDDWSCADVGITPTNPQLMPLADNGGPTMTHAIAHTSPALNTGLQCLNTVDQRYVPRDAKCDVGAFEFTDFTNVTLTIDPNVKVDAATGRAMLTGTIKCSRDETLKLALELHQDQKVGKEVVDVHAASNPQVTCGPTVKSWSQKMILSEGAWQNGAARATAQTVETPEWAKPASAANAVKISITRK
jgi:hypothetical protein